MTVSRTMFKIIYLKLAIAWLHWYYSNKYQDLSWNCTQDGHSMLPQGSGRICIQDKTRFPRKNSRAVLGLTEKLWSYIQKAGIAFTIQHSTMQLGILLFQQKPSGNIFQEQFPTAARITVRVIKLYKPYSYDKYRVQSDALLVLLFSPLSVSTVHCDCSHVCVTNKLGVLSFVIQYLLNLWNVSLKTKQSIAQQIFLDSLIGSKAIWRRVNVDCVIKLVPLSVLTPSWNVSWRTSTINRKPIRSTSRQAPQFIPFLEGLTELNQLKGFSSRKLTQRKQLNPSNSDKIAPSCTSPLEKANWNHPVQKWCITIILRLLCL